MVSPSVSKPLSSAWSLAEIKEIFMPEVVPVKVLELIKIGPGMILCPTAARECTAQIGHMVSLETSPGPPPPTPNTTCLH